MKIPLAEQIKAIEEIYVAYLGHNADWKDVAVMEAVLETLRSIEEAQPEDKTETPQINERLLLYKFMELSYVICTKIASKLNLIEKSEAGMSDIERRRLEFQRAKDRGLFSELEKMIDESEKVRK